MSFDDVGIDLRQGDSQIFDQLSFRGIGSPNKEQEPVVTGAAQPDRENPILGVGCIRKSALWRGDLDVELAAPQPSERQVGIEPPAVLQQELGLPRADHFRINRTLHLP